MSAHPDQVDQRDEAGASNLEKARAAKAEIHANTGLSNHARRDATAAKDFEAIDATDGACVCGRAAPAHARRANGKRGGIPVVCPEYFEREL